MIKMQQIKYMRVWVKPRRYFFLWLIDGEDKDRKKIKIKIWSLTSENIKSLSNIDYFEIYEVITYQKLCYGRWC